MTAESDIPETNQQAINTVETALEHAAHGWNALKKAGDLPPDTDDRGWPPVVPHRHVGSAAYHWAAVIGYLRLVHEGLLQQGDPDELAGLDEGWANVPED